MPCAFEVSEVDYLLKPFDDERFMAMWQRVGERSAMKAVVQETERFAELLTQLRAGAAPTSGVVTDGALVASYPLAPRGSQQDMSAPRRYTDRVLIRHEGRSFKVRMADVQWIETAGNYVVLHAGQDKHQLRETLTNLEGRLDPDHFVRIHRRIIVSVDAMRELQAWFGGDQIMILKDGTRLRVSRNFRLWDPTWHWDSLFFVGLRYYAGAMLVVYWAIVCAHAAIRLPTAYREQAVVAARLESDLIGAQLHALRSQLNPHFLFNALNSVVTLIGRDTQGAQRMVVRLSELLRATLAAGDESEVQLRYEIELVERYLDIERIRFGDRLVVTFDVDPAVQRAVVPALLLQPLVENAITHGLSQISTRGLLSVSGWASGRNLHLEVRDNGPGPSVRPRRPGSGIGISNLRARLERLYGDEQRVSLAAAEGGGCVASVTLPIVMAKAPTTAATEASDVLDKKIPVPT